MYISNFVYNDNQLCGDVSFVSEVGLDRSDIGFTKVETKPIQYSVGFLNGRLIQSASLIQSKLDLSV